MSLPLIYMRYFLNYPRRVEVEAEALVKVLQTDGLSPPPRSCRSRGGCLNGSYFIRQSWFLLQELYGGYAKYVMYYCFGDDQMVAFGETKRDINMQTTVGELNRRCFTMATWSGMTY